VAEDDASSRPASTQPSPLAAEETPVTTASLDRPPGSHAAEAGAEKAGSAPAWSRVEPPPAGPPSTQSPTSDGQPVKPPAKKRGRFGWLGELPALLIIAFLLALLIKTFLVQAFYIPSESMLPTLKVGDRVLVNKVGYHLHHPSRGDVIVFSDPHGEAVQRNPLSGFLHWLVEGFGVQTDPNKDFIKRVIGLPGETVEFAQCHVMINGRVLKEPYATVKDCSSTYPATRVPAGELFVMGDNRPNSNDSRYGLGYIPYDKVIGRAFVIIWPPSRIGGLHGF